MTLPKITPLSGNAERELPEGDERGRYGFGRPAHGTDPNARYHFHRAQDDVSTVKEYVEDVGKDFGEEQLSSPPNRRTPGY